MDAEKRIRIDIPTLIAISIAAWSLVNFLHEVIGHAGSAVLLGIPVRAVSTTTLFVDWGQVESFSEIQIIHAGGTVMNLLTGVIALFFLRSSKVTHSATRYFLWLFSTISFIIVILHLVSTPHPWIYITVAFLDARYAW